MSQTMRREEPIRRDPPIVAGRVPPHDLDAEAAVLSAILLSRDALDRVLDLLRQEHFYSDANGWIYRAATEVSCAGDPVDVITVATWLRTRDRLSQVDGPKYLAQLADATPAVAHVGAHAAVVYENWRLRQLIATCQHIAAEGYGDVGTVQEFIDSAEQAIYEIARCRDEADQAPTMHDVLTKVFADLQRSDPDPGVSTGLVDLDGIMGPMKRGQMIVVGAHSGIGKSSLGMQIVQHTAMTPIRCVDNQGSYESAQGVLVFSAEMTKEEIALRALFSEARVDSTKANAMKYLRNEEWSRITAASGRIALPNIYFDDRPGLGPLQIRSKARRVVKQADRAGFDLRLILVDYLQLLDGTQGGKKSQERREREIAEVSWSLKNLAKEIGIPIIVLAQLNDDARREKRAPRKEDLRECKAAAQDADKVILIWNQAAAERSQVRRRGQENEPLPPEVCDLIVDKNRGGKTGKAHALFMPTFTLFTNLAKEDYERLEQEERTRVQAPKRTR
jgi:replicative DNA helicase